MQKIAGTRTSDFLRVSETQVRTGDGRLFELVGREPYRRKAGGDTELLVWSGVCQACGAAFEIRTPAGIEDTKAFARVHCDAHKLTRAEAMVRLREVLSGGDLKRFPAHPTGAKSLPQKAQAARQGGRTDVIGERIGGAR